MKTPEKRRRKSTDTYILHRELPCRWRENPTIDARTHTHTHTHGRGQGHMYTRGHK